MGLFIPPAPPDTRSLSQGLQDWLRQLRLLLTPTTAQFLQQTGDIATTSIFTVPSDGMYQVGLYAITTVTGTAGSYTIFFPFTDPSGAKTFTVGGNDLTTLNSGTLSFAVQLVSGSSFSISTTRAGVVGNPKYSLYISITRMS